MNKKNNNKIFTSMFLLAFAFMVIVPMTSAAITVELKSPVTGFNYSTSMIVNCSNNIMASSNASLLYASNGGTQDTWVLLNNISNEHYIAAFDISSFIDAATYNMTCAVYNATATYYATAIPVITIDNTAPVITSTVGAGQVEYMTPTTLTCSAADAIDSATTITRTITKADGSTVTVTSSSYTTTGTDTNVLGAYTWTCSAVDDSGNVGETILSFNVDTDDGDGVDTTLTATSSKDEMGSLPVILVIVLLVAIIASIGGYAVISKKGGRK